MDAQTLIDVIEYIDEQINIIHQRTINTKGGLTEAEAIGAIASRKTLIELKEYLHELNTASIIEAFRKDYGLE